jgi:hypothetical protein
MSKMYQLLNGVRVELTEEEKTARQSEIDDFNSKSAERKLARIKELRLQKLEETDWWVLRGDITDAQKLYRKNLRDIPTNYDSSKYDELLARETDKTKDNFGQLTHSIWSKP